VWRSSLAPEEQKVDGFSEAGCVKVAETSEKYESQLRVNCSMDIIIDPLCTDKQVLVRKLTSNAADALEKARLHSVGCEPLARVARVGGGDRQVALGVCRAHGSREQNVYFVKFTEQAERYDKQVDSTEERLECEQAEERGHLAP